MLTAPATAIAQQTSPAEISVGYLALTAGADGYPKGYYVDLAANINSRFAVVVASDGAFRSQSFEYIIPGRGPSGTIIRERVPLTIKTTTRGLLIGGRFTWRDPHVDYFVEGAGGAAHLSARAETGTSTEAAASLREAYRTSRWRPALHVGAAANVAISSRSAIRAGVAYRRLERMPAGFAEGEDRGRGPNQVIVTAGVTLRIG